MTTITQTLHAIVDLALRVALRPDRGMRYRCTECGARVGQPCVNPYCYGSLGDPPPSDDQFTPTCAG